jgi:hypothetical protein
MFLNTGVRYVVIKQSIFNGFFLTICAGDMLKFVLNVEINYGRFVGHVRLVAEDWSKYIERILSWLSFLF